MLHCLIFLTQFHAQIKGFLSASPNFSLSQTVLSSWRLIASPEQLQVEDRMPVLALCKKTAKVKAVSVCPRLKRGLNEF